MGSLMNIITMTPFMHIIIIVRKILSDFPTGNSKVLQQNLNSCLNQSIQFQKTAVCF